MFSTPVEARTADRMTTPQERLGKQTWSYPLGAALTGVAFHLFLMALSFASVTSLSYFGVTNQTVNDTVWSNYLGIIVRSLFRSVLAHVGLGVFFGLATGRFFLLLAPRFGRRWLTRSLALIAAMSVLHALFLLDGMARFPQLFVEGFQSRGGLLAWIQETAAFTMPLWLPHGLLTAALLAWVFLELRNIKRARSGRLAARVSTAALPLLLTLAATYFWFLQPAWRSSEFSWTETSAAQVSSDGTTRARHPNLLLLAADSLRPDRILDGSGGSRPVAPNLSRLAHEGVEFDRAYTVFARTFPSWISLFTGQYAHHHGIRHMFPTAPERAFLPPMVADLLARDGYHTAVVSDYAGDIFPRAQMGFQRVVAPYFHFPSILRQRVLAYDRNLLPYLANPYGSLLFVEIDGLAEFANPETLTDRVIDVVKHLPEPWFVVVFYSTSHFPYAAPAPYFKRFTDPAYRGPFKYYKPHEMAAHVTSAGDVTQVRDIFDGTIRAIDDQIGRLLNVLSADNRLDRTIVVATADHGENLYEGSLGMGHGDHLRGEVALRIPMIVWGAGRIPANKKIHTSVRSIDLAPTLLDLAGVAKPTPSTFDGTSLQDLWTAQGRLETPPPDREVFMETGMWFADKGDEFFQKLRLPYPDLISLLRIDTATNHEVVLRQEFAGVVETAKHRALYLDGYKLVYMPTPSGIVYELFDPEADPLNEHDLTSERPADLERMKARLFEILSDGDPDRIQNGFVIGKRRPPPHDPVPQPSWLRLQKEILGP
jgi:arylsulfatase A-like enzyme